MTTNFIHLNVHSEYSIRDGICRIPQLVMQAKAQGAFAVALTDHSNMFAQVKFFKAALNAGIKPIFGADVFLQHRQDPEKYSKVTLLCMDKTGYHNLTCLISQAYTEGQIHGDPVIRRDWLRQQHEGLIIICGSPQDEIGQALLGSHEHEAKQIIRAYMQLFKNRFYLSLQRTGHTDAQLYTQKAIALAQTLQCPLIASNAVCFLKAEDFEAHEARVCIHAGYVLEDSSRPKNYTEQQYLKSPEEMQGLFKDIPQALENTIEIAKRCNVQLELGKVSLPDFQIPEDETTESYLQKLSEQGLEKRFALKQCISPRHSKEAYYERLKTEIEVINNMGFAGYFLIVADFIQWAKQNAIPVGPGRGSGAGSLVAYALQITDLDPLQYDLLFERFLNPERVSMPDFDIDFCMDKRDLVIEYVAQKYGRDCVSQIITFGTMAARAVIRDVGRVLGHPYGFVDRIAKQVPFELGITLDKALEEGGGFKQLYDEEEEVKALVDLAQKLEGVARNAGKHAGGVVIAPGKLTDFTPLYCEEGSTQIVSQLDKDDVEAVGLVKFDFLGLRTLTIIDWTCQTIQKDITDIPLDDKATFALLKRCESTAVFQLESRGMKDLIKRLQPDCFEDIIALVALFRPGPLQSGMVDDFINRKHGRARVEYPHPKLEPILKPTYGVILYQEQVMQIAQELAGYSLGDADLLRRAMGKKKPEEMAKQREIFVSGAMQRDVDKQTATHVFDLMEKFAGYGFNKSHSAAYALVAYQTAWLKAHYPAAFMAAVLSSDMDNTDKVVMLIEECENMGIKVLPPDVNQGKHQFVMLGEQSIVYGLGAIKGVGEAAIASIISSREKDGKYSDLFDFCRRIDLRKANRRVVEALIRSGALDHLGAHRASLMATQDRAMQLAEQQAKNVEHGQSDMFFSDADTSSGNEVYIDIPEWTDDVRLRHEKETLGLYLTGHPISQYQEELKQLVTDRINNLRPNDKQTVRIGGMLTAIRTVKTKQGKRMGILTLDDGTSRLDATLFADDYAKYSESLEKDKLYILSGTVSHDDFTGGLRMRAKELFNISDAREQFAKRICINVNKAELPGDFVEQLQILLSPHANGKCPVHIQYRNERGEGLVKLGPNWQVLPEEKLISQLRAWLGSDHITINY
jgi:DNA polymerase-3 subunit alpha